MNMQKVFSTSERTKILYYILEDPDAEYRVNEVARKLKLNKGTVSGYFKLLLKIGLVKKKNKFFCVELPHPVTRQIKILFNLEKIYVKPLLFLKPRSIGLYGSWAQGTNGKMSDIDIWVKFDKHPGEEKIAIAQGKMRNKLKYDINILVIDPQRLERLKKDAGFCNSLMFGSVILWGEGLEA